MELTAHATRSGSWWTVEVPAIDGLFTQAKRLDQVPAMVRDAAALLTGDPEDSFTVVVIPHLPAVDVELVAKEVNVARTAYEVAAATLTNTNQVAVTVLRNLELPVRDVAWILGLSPQRVSVIDGHRAETSTQSPAHLEVRHRMGLWEAEETHTAMM